MYCSYNNISMVITYPDMPQGRGKKLLANPVKKKAAELGLRVLEAKKIGKRNQLPVRRKVSTGGGGISAVVILPESFLSLIPHRCINVHPSLLPDTGVLPP
ncbi:MAG: formyltransferase family protein [Actinomycetota bacterium]|nr:formyltransferase family protein [Actinomycetota bacterium]